MWALTPPSGSELSSGLGAIQSLVRAQPVPVGIVLFTLFEIALWAARHQLPFSAHAHPPLRPDLPVRLRGSFERARALLDEADMILARHDKAIVRDLAAKERDRLRGQLQDLRDAMDRVPFDEHGFLESLAHADGEVDVHLARWRKSEVREYLEAILMAVAVAFALRAFVIEAFKIPSGSMIPTLMVGDHIFVNKFSYGPAIPYTHSRVWTHMPPQRGDVMVFAFPEHPEQDFIKRVIVDPGRQARGQERPPDHQRVGGAELPRRAVGATPTTTRPSAATRATSTSSTWATSRTSRSTIARREAFPTSTRARTTPRTGEVWVMGDNRNNSHDSRMWFGGQGGGVPFENIRGRALFVWLSVSDNGLDWSREGVPVMGRPRLPPTAAGLEPQFEQCLKSRPAVTNPPPAAPRRSHEHAVRAVLWACAVGLGAALPRSAPPPRRRSSATRCVRAQPELRAGRGVYADCSQQCSDDPACIDRCTEATVDQPKH